FPTQIAGACLSAGPHNFAITGFDTLSYLLGSFVVRVGGSLQTLVNVFTYVLWTFANRSCLRSNQSRQQQGRQHHAIKSQGHHAPSGIRKTECYGLAAPPGSRTVNTDPLPSSLATVTSPPIMRASLRVMASPPVSIARSQFGTAVLGFGGYAEFLVMPRMRSSAVWSALSSFGSGGM